MDDHALIDRYGQSFFVPAVRAAQRRIDGSHSQLPTVDATLIPLSLPPSLDPSIAAMSLCKPIIGAMTYIIAVMASAPTNPPSAARANVGFTREPTSGLEDRILDRLGL